MTMDLFFSNVVLILGFMSVLWLVSVYKRDASIVDPWWSMLFFGIAANTTLRTGATASKVLLVSLVGLWAVRLFMHLTVRAVGHDEDPRYQGFRKHYGAERYWWVSFFQVFMLQGCLALIISAPLQLASALPGEPGLGILDLVGAAIVLFGTVFESVADWQLQRFRSDPDKAGGVMDTGLFRYSRHPNYFGEAVLWCGFFIMSLSGVSVEPVRWAGIIGPVLMIAMLLRVSGVVMLDKHMVRTKPKYADYIARTSAFIPMPPQEHPSGAPQPSS